MHKLKKRRKSHKTIHIQQFQQELFTLFTFIYGYKLEIDKESVLIYTRTLIDPINK